MNYNEITKETYIEILNDKEIIDENYPNSYSIHREFAWKQYQLQAASRQLPSSPSRASGFEGNSVTKRLVVEALETTVGIQSN